MVVSLFPCCMYLSFLFLSLESCCWWKFSGCAGSANWNSCSCRRWWWDHSLARLAGLTTGHFPRNSLFSVPRDLQIRFCRAFLSSNFFSSPLLHKVCGILKFSRRLSVLWDMLASEEFQVLFLVMFWSNFTFSYIGTFLFCNSKDRGALFHAFLKASGKTTAYEQQRSVCSTSSWSLYPVFLIKTNAAP